MGYAAPKLNGKLKCCRNIACPSFKSGAAGYFVKAAVYFDGVKYRSIITKPRFVLKCRWECLLIPFGKHQSARSRSEYTSLLHFIFFRFPINVALNKGACECTLKHRLLNESPAFLFFP